MWWVRIRAHIFQLSTGIGAPRVKTLGFSFEDNNRILWEILWVAYKVPSLTLTKPNLTANDGFKTGRHIPFQTCWICNIQMFHQVPICRPARERKLNRWIGWALALAEIEPSPTICFSSLTQTLCYLTYMFFSCCKISGNNTNSFINLFMIGCCQWLGVIFYQSLSEV